MNAFAILGFDPRPWLELVAIKNEAAARKSHGEFKLEVNEAEEILADPWRRLQHLFKLTYPDTAIGGGPVSLPKMLAEWFEAASSLEGRMSAFLARKRTASSPLSRALLAREAMPLHEEAEGCLKKLATHEAEWLAALREWDARWQEGDPMARSCEVLAMFTQAFAYLARWRATVRGWIFSLLEP